MAATAQKVFDASFYNAGQACLAIKRVYVEDSIYDAFCDAMASLAESAVIGNGLDVGTQIGPMQNAAQFEKAQYFIDVAKRDGTIIAGGAVSEGPGYFVKPTIVRDITDGSELVDQEQFSPVLPIVRIVDAEDGLARANCSPYGLGGSVWSADAERARALAARMQCGTVWINQHLKFGPHIPFAGAKQSGVGVEWSDLGLAEFTQIKVINEGY